MSESQQTPRSSLPSRPTPPVRIEFLGAPGAGKSSLIPEAIDELARADVNAAGISDAVFTVLRDDMSDRLFRPVMRYMPHSVARRFYKHLAARSQDRLLALRAFFLEYPDAMIAILDALKDRRDIDPRQDLALGWIVELLWQYQLVATHGTTISHLVLDEGFCNRALTLFGYRFSENDEPRLRRYIESIPEPDLVIVVTGEPEAMAMRATDRRRFDFLGVDEAVLYTRSVAECVATTARLLAERDVDVRVVRNDSSPEAASSEVRKIIRNWLARDTRT